MDDAPRFSTADTKQRLADSALWPVLARLPDVTADAATQPLTKQGPLAGNHYRFDPPQSAEGAAQPEIGHPKSETSAQPHVFQRARRVDRHGRTQRRNSPILPRSNPFSIPSARLIDSLAPAVRFLTMVVLFTAAGIWIQMMGRSALPSARSVEPPKTASQPAVAPIKSAADPAVSAPTAAGPLETTPQSGARVGRANEANSFAQGPSTGSIPRPEHPAVMPPHSLIVGSGQLPRVQTTDSRSDEVVDDPVRKDASAGDDAADDAPAVARFPGFLIEIPTR